MPISLSDKPVFSGLVGWRTVERANWRSHPLIHTFAPETLAQDVGKKKAEPKTSHFLSLNIDIVTRPQEAECGLKYEISSFQIKRTEPFSDSTPLIRNHPEHPSASPML